MLLWGECRWMVRLVVVVVLGIGELMKLGGVEVLVV